jgi:TolB-like protein
VGALAIWGLVAAVWIARGWTPDPEGVANPALAVLPFDNLGSADARYFADGVHEDVLTQLSKIASLDVISRTSVMAYRDAQRNVRDIARELGVGAVVEGSVRHDPLGNRVRVVVQLIDAQTDRHLWAEQYDRDLDDVFAIQNELALSIARALSATLTPDEERRIAQRPVPNTAAYDLILRGRELYGQNLDANTMAMELFRQATVADRTSAEAWAELANAYGQQVQLGGVGGEWAVSAVACARRALELDPELALAHKALGLGLGQMGRWDEAEPAYQRALELSPNYVTPMINISARLHAQGRCEEGLQVAAEARRKDPLSDFAAGHMADQNACLGRIDEAVEWIAVATELKPDVVWWPYFHAFYFLGADRIAEADSIAEAFLARDRDEPVALLVAGESALIKGDLPRARQRYDRLLEVAPGWRFQGATALAQGAIALSLMSEGQEVAAAQLLERAILEADSIASTLILGSYYTRALPGLHAMAGDEEEALAWLERAAPLLAYFEVGRLRIDPRLASIRDHPRFDEILDGRMSEIDRMRTNVESREAIEGRVR